MRFICNFSCGAASAVATKMTINQYGLSHEVLVVNAYLASEDPDNRRFLADCEAWFGRPITVVRDFKYGADAYEVFRKRRYTKGLQGAACSRALKRDVLDSHFPWSPEDTAVLGFTADEQDRFDRWIEKRCAPFYEQEETRGQPSLPPGVYFRMLFVGYFENLDSQRGIAWRCADSLSLRAFLGIPLDEGTPDHSTMTNTRKRLPSEVFDEVFQFVLGIAEAKSLRPQRRLRLAR